MLKKISFLLALVIVFAGFAKNELVADTVSKDDPNIVWMEPIVSEISIFREGMALISNWDKYGFIDKNGKVVVPLKYKNASAFFEGLAMVEDDNGNVGFINKKGEEYIKLDYKGGNHFSEGLAGVQNKEGKWGFIDKSGNKAIDFIYKNVMPFSEGLAGVQNQEGKWGYIDKTGELTIPYKYELGMFFKENLAAVRNFNNKWGYIDKTGKEVVPLIYEYVDDASDGLLYVQNDKEEWSVIDKNGKTVIPFKYKRIGKYQEGLFPVSVDKADGSNFGFIDKNGNVVIPYKFLMAEPFKDGVSIIAHSAGFKDLIDKNGQFITKREYEELYNFNEGLVVAKKDNKFFILNKEGKVLVDFGNLIRNSETIVSEGVLTIERNDGVLGIYKINPQNQIEKPNADKTINAMSTPFDMTVNGKLIDKFEVYLIDGHNYFKLRDVAKLADGTNSKFSVTWNKDKKLISIETFKPYLPLGTELKGGDGKDKKAVKSSFDVEVNNRKIQLIAYLIENQTYYQIRDLAKELGFEVDWNEEKRMVELVF